jgi:ATP-binding cassette subfamily F protein 3
VILLAILSINNISKYFGDQPVLSGISLQLHQGEKVGLVGPNGAGKTTLLKIITGEVGADEGAVYMAKELSLGYLSQKPGMLPHTTLEEYLMEALKDVVFLRQELASLERKMASPAIKENSVALDSLMQRYGDLAHLFEEKGGYMLEKRLSAVAGGLGFTEGDFKRRVSEFSGGEKTRAQLAFLILQEPDLLLLDEPTNYLDIDAVEWLENFLRDCPGSIIVVSHDRYFLDRVVGRIVALRNGNLRNYRGNYSAYISQREIEEISAEKAYKKQQAAIKKDLEFIRTAAADERTKRQARSREKRLRALNTVSRPMKDKSMNLNFSFAGRSGKIVLSMENVSKAFGETVLFKNATFKINWGDRVALVGPNGAGKTTLLRIITGEEMQSEGKIYLGPSVKPVYFDQEQQQLDLLSTPLETIMNASSMGEAEARKHLGRYLFREDEIFKKIGDLSGGEKSRLALAKIALAAGNFLILDEPTNHLDIAGVEELEAALDDYQGTLLVVSHDRYFVSRMATRILEIRGQRVRLFKGDYREYEEMRAREKEEKSALKDHPEALSRRREEEKKRREEREKILKLRRQKRTLKKRLQELEEEILLKEQKVSSFQDRLADAGIYQNFDDARSVAEEYKKAQKRLHLLYEQWEAAALQLEELPEEDKI